MNEVEPQPATIAGGGQGGLLDSQLGAPADTGLLRLKSLDGLRGVAALVVVFHHALLVVPAVAATIYAAPQDPRSPQWWLYRTPLRILWAGPEAVLVFFVLSGYVLTILATRRSRRPQWKSSYYAQRLVRLYVPVWGAVALAVLLACLVPRVTTGLSPWLSMHQDINLNAIVSDLTLLVNTSTLNTPLWSLQWEVWFSVALPLGWVMLRTLPVRGHWLGWAGALIATSVAGRMGLASQTLPAAISPGGHILDLALTYVPVFGVGMVLAYERASVERAARMLQGRRVGRWIWPIIVCASLVALVSSTFADSGRRSWEGIVTSGAGVAGAAILLIASLEWQALRATLQRASIQWLGARSFSLYLVHEPLLVAVAISIRANSWHWLELAPFIVALSIVLTALFYSLVEKPSIKLSHRVARMRTQAPSTSTAIVGEFEPERPASGA